MSLYRYKGSKVWTMDFMFQGQRVRESTGTRSKTLAGKIKDKRRRELEEGAGGIRKRERPRIFSVAADAWLEMKRSNLAPKTIVIEKTNLAHLKPELGRRLVCDIDACDVARYQQRRLEQGASPKTVNLEVGPFARFSGVTTFGRSYSRTCECSLPVKMWGERSQRKRRALCLWLALTLALVPCCPS